MEKPLFSKGRYVWLDFAKMAAMLCVILGHTSSLITNGMPGCLMGVIVAFNMPLFVLLSGFTAISALNKIVSLTDLVNYAGKIYNRLILPAVFLSAINQSVVHSLFARKLWFVYAIVVLLEWVSPKLENKVPRVWYLCVRIFVLSFLLIASQWLNMFWFLSMLMKLQLSVALGSLILSYFNTNVRRCLYVAGVCWLISYFAFDSWVFEMSFYFFAGMLVKQVVNIERLAQISVFWSIIAAIVGVVIMRVFTIDYGFYGYGLEKLIEMGLPYVYVCRLLVALLLCFSIIIVIIKYSTQENWFSRMGRYTMAFYIVHALLLDTWMRPCLEGSSLLAIEAPWATLVWLLFAALLTTFSYVIIIVCDKFRITRTLVIGKS